MSLYWLLCSLHVLSHICQWSAHLHMVLHAACVLGASPFRVLTRQTVFTQKPPWVLLLVAVSGTVRGRHKNVYVKLIVAGSSKQHFQS
uniref:Secreted protein n=1 Tax=Rhipicephalus appendiculatus TaxID=34631 RepID=A0A131Y9L1_RHIAP